MTNNKSFLKNYDFLGERNNKLFIGTAGVPPATWAKGEIMVNETLGYEIAGETPAVRKEGCDQLNRDDGYPI